MGPLRRGAALVLLAAACAAQAQDCDVPGDGTSLRRALLRVKYLPESEQWELSIRAQATPHYVLSLSDPIVSGGRCYWPVEARAGGMLWHRFFVTPAGEDILVEMPGGATLPLEAWRRR